MTAAPPRPPTRFALVGAFIRLRWLLLASSLRSRGTERLGAAVVTMAALFAGTIGFVTLAVAGPLTDDPLELITMVTLGITVASVGLGVVTGVSRPIDLRVLAVEPISNGSRAIGLLAATAAGPAGLATMAIGAGAVVGLAGGAASLPVLVAAVLLWMLILLLAARTATEMLTMLVRRAPRTGHLVVGLAALGLYGLIQLGPAMLAGLRPDERERLVELAGWTPVGQLARAMTVDAPAASSLGVGALTVALLAAVHLTAAGRAGHDAGSGQVAHRGGSRRVPLIERLAGPGPVGAVARRRLQVRFRRPRAALEAVAAAGIGMAAILAPVVVNGGSRAVLLGGAVHLAVLLVAGNSFGNEGSAVVDDLVAGGPRLLVAGTVRSTLLITAPLGVLGPLAAVAIAGAWHLLPAGWLVALGALLSGTGGAMVQSVLVPIPYPETDDPFANGESGRALASGLALLAVLATLAVAMSPVLVALWWATSAGSTLAVTVAAGASVGAGWLLCRAGTELAVRWLERETPAFAAALVPAR